MSNYKSVTWGYAALFSLVCGLSSCTLLDNDRGYDNAPAPSSITYEQAPAQKAKVAGTAAVKSSKVSTEPVQKSTPGPKRAAAPQIPVIQ